MNNVTLIILAIGFVVWLVSTIYKNAEDARKRQEQDRERPRRPSAASEIDRFLEEIQRRRQQQQQQQAVRPAPAPPSLARPQQAPRPVAPIVLERPAARPPVQARPAAARPLPARPAAARPATARPIESVRPARAAAVQALIVEEPVFIAQPAFSPQGPGAEIPIVRAAPKAVSPHLNDVIQALHSRKGVRQAILMGMVLGPPRCRQHAARSL